MQNLTGNETLEGEINILLKRWTNISFTMVPRVCICSGGTDTLFRILNLH